MKALTDTFLYNNANTKNFLSDIKKLTDEDFVDPKDLEDEIKVIGRRFRYSLLMQTLDAFEKGYVKCLYSEFVNITRLIPMFQIPASNGLASVVNIKPYCIKNKQNNYNIDNRTLYALLECGYITKKLREDENRFLMNQNIIKLSTLIYVKLMNKIFDKLFGINLIPDRSDQLNYVLAKFFLLYVLEKQPSDNINTIAYSCIYNNLPRNLVESADENFDENAYNSLQAFFDSLANNFIGLNKLTIRSFIDNWMIMYGENTVLSIENYPIMLVNCICGAIFTARINRDNLFENVVGRETNNLHTEICRILK